MINKFLEVKTIIKQILNLKVRFSINKLLILISVIRKQLIKTIFKNKAI